MQPQEIHVVDGGRRMQVAWPDGTIDDLTATELRQRARDAPSERRRIDAAESRSDAGFDEVAITDVVAIGHYAVNLKFSDGHDRGIYPWTYLKEIAGN